MDSPYLLETLAEDFWNLAGYGPEGSVDIEAAAGWALPVEIAFQARLHLHHVAARMPHLGVDATLMGRDRRLRGCLIAYHGKGLILIDAADPPDEQRFTLAHELAHFLLDYQRPRQRALAALGEAILPVLDGARSPTVEERLHAVLTHVPLGVLHHLMERPDEGLPAGTVLEVEDRADRLALELLAPARLLLERMVAPSAPLAFRERLAFLTHALVTEKNLPPAKAAAYARYLLRQQGGPGFRDWLLGTW
ncbi:MAG TPA: ImmA/IrrE family metallo-endopeptidase [Ktedonobacterales bacterium]|nr:ImmA/IrrE family metallo-endopeptidase [Ktedonobacterales bacterium]